jgi:hypothetical protein
MLFLVPLRRLSSPHSVDETRANDTKVQLDVLAADHRRSERIGTSSFIRARRRC